MIKQISVIMPVHNGAPYIANSVESILKQSFKDFEFIIINDGSTDRSTDILENYAKKDNRIKLIHQENMGLIKTLNRAIVVSEGNYIARMDADDISLPDRLQKQVTFLGAHPDVGMVGTGCLIIDESGKAVDKRVYPVDDSNLRRVLISFNPFIHSSVMLRREVFTIVGMYDEKRLRVEDYELWLRIARHFKLANLQDILLLYRVRRDSVSTLFENEQYRLSIVVRIEAIRNGQYPWWSIISIIEPSLNLIIPSSTKRFIRKYIFKREVSR